ncbi:MAG: hypothetical protein ACYCR9_01560 [Cuniculiplasma sp.]
MKGIRFVIAVITVGERTNMSIVSMLLDIIESHGIKISSLLMDGGSFSAHWAQYRALAG